MPVAAAPVGLSSASSTMGVEPGPMLSAMTNVRRSCSLTVTVFAGIKSAPVVASFNSIVTLTLTVAERLRSPLGMAISRDFSPVLSPKLSSPISKGVLMPASGAVMKISTGGPLGAA